MGAQPDNCNSAGEGCFSWQSMTSYESESACETALTTFNCTSWCAAEYPFKDYCGYKYCAGSDTTWIIYCCCKNQIP